LGGSTVTIIALVPHHSTVGWMMLSRLSEVGWGVVVGLATVWLAEKARGVPGSAPPATAQAPATPASTNPPPAPTQKLPP
jgi:hypothetical protein